MDNDSHAMSAYVARHVDVACESLSACYLTWLKSVGANLLQKRLKLEGQKCYYES
jgi:hypothetical protein